MSLWVPAAAAVAVSYYSQWTIFEDSCSSEKLRLLPFPKNPPRDVAAVSWQWVGTVLLPGIDPHLVETPHAQ